MGRVDAAADDIRQAVKDHGVKWDNVTQDSDLQPLLQREDLYDELAREVGRVGDTAQSAAKLISEIRTPFRGLRIYVTGALAAGAFISGAILTTKLPGSLRADENAQPIGVLARNLGIDVAGLLGFGWAFVQDIRAGRRNREKALRVRSHLVSGGFCKWDQSS